LILFFQFYIIKITKRNIQQKINVITTDILNGIKTDQNIQPFLTNYDPIKNLKYMFQKDDDLTTLNNSWLIQSLNIFTIFLWVVFIVFVYILHRRCDEKIHLKELIIENTLVFSVVAIFEILFFFKIAFVYVPIQPTEIAKYIVNYVKKILSS
jgi:hypothetical protein